MGFKHCNDSLFVDSYRIFDDAQFECSHLFFPIGVDGILL